MDELGRARRRRPALAISARRGGASWGAVTNASKSRRYRCGQYSRRSFAQSWADVAVARDDHDGRCRAGPTRLLRGRHLVLRSPDLPGQGAGRDFTSVKIWARPAAVKRPAPEAGARREVRRARRTARSRTGSPGPRLSSVSTRSAPTATRCSGSRPQPVARRLEILQLRAVGSRRSSARSSAPDVREHQPGHEDHRLAGRVDGEPALDQPADQHVRLSEPNFRQERMRRSRTGATAPLPVVETAVPSPNASSQTSHVASDNGS